MGLAQAPAAASPAVTTAPAAITKGVRTSRRACAWPRYWSKSAVELISTGRAHRSSTWIQEVGGLAEVTLATHTDLQAINFQASGHTSVSRLHELMLSTL